MLYLKLKDRLRAFGIHLIVNAIVAVLAALSIFYLWYPYPYRELSGGLQLFFIVVGVDIVLGPLVTFTIFNKAKSRRALRFDFTVIALLQLVGLAYGMWTVYVARPVLLAFEYDSFRVVHAIEVPQSQLSKAPPALRQLSLTGPKLISLRPFADEKEKFDDTLIALQGVQLSAQPSLWRDYAAARSEVLAKAKPLSALIARMPAKAAQLQAAAQRAGRQPKDLVYLPLIGRSVFWTIVLDPQTAQPLAYAPVDSF